MGIYYKYPYPPEKRIRLSGIYYRLFEESDKGVWMIEIDKEEAETMATIFLTDIDDNATEETYQKVKALENGEYVRLNDERTLRKHI